MSLITDKSKKSESKTSSKTSSHFKDILSSVDDTVSFGFAKPSYYERLYRNNDSATVFIDDNEGLFKLYDYSKEGRYNPLTSNSFSQQLGLQDEINKLKRKMSDLAKSSEADKADKKKIAEDFKKLQNELIIKEKINHIIPRICEEARSLLFKSDDFKALFADARSCNAVVVSIDIRRSTELMLKARKPELFAKFITELSQKLSQIIIGNYGIFDKFTGDGILAFFPDFYSGKDAMFFALKAAQECHEVFKKHYNASRDCFNVFIKSSGLGIGVDFGPVTLVNTNNELTVVGIPVVYACRMSGAEAGNTILNQPAKEHAEIMYQNHTNISETEINIKNEGIAVAYKVEINERALKIEKPNWQNLINENKQFVKNPAKKAAIKKKRTHS